MWHNGLSINISLLTELFTVFFQKTKLLQILPNLVYISIIYSGAKTAGNTVRRCYHRQVWQYQQIKASPLLMHSVVNHEIPVAVKRIVFQVHSLKVLIRHLSPSRVFPTIQTTCHFESFLCSWGFIACSLLRGLVQKVPKIDGYPFFINGICRAENISINCI